MYGKISDPVKRYWMPALKTSRQTGYIYVTFDDNGQFLSDLVEMFL